MFQDNKEEKVKKIYLEYHRLMGYVAYRILKNEQDAEDAVQDAFITISNNISKITEPVCEKTKYFALIIVKRKAIDILRKKRQQK